MVASILKVFMQSQHYTNSLQDNSICTYTFAVDQQFFHGDLLQNLTLSAVVRVDCYSGELKLLSLVAPHCLLYDLYGLK